MQQEYAQAEACATQITPTRLCRVAGSLPCITLKLGSISVARDQSKTPVIGVAIIEDQRETREGLSFLINSTDRFECRHIYASMEAALAGDGANPRRVSVGYLAPPATPRVQRSADSAR